jgi:hypothetical protein
VIESFVDLTYRGLSLGRRIKLGQVRPSSGYVELPAPMPVGTRVAIATDEGVTIEAVVTWVYEQVAGSDRTPGMIVAPALTAAAAAAWWQDRVALPEDDAPRMRSARTRPVTVRPRPKTLSTPPLAGPTIDDSPTIVADLDALVAAAAGLPPPRPPGDHGELRTAVMNAIDQAQLQNLARSPDAEATIAVTSEHVVIDDGHKTILMEAIDPTELGIDAGAGGELEAGDDLGDDADGPGTGEGGEDPAAGSGGVGAQPVGRGRKRRRRRTR